MLQSNSKYWELTLKQGEWFETNVTRPWLLTNRPTYWITDSRNHIRHGQKGPRLVKGDQELVLPDFRLDDPETKTSSWLDSKVKSQPFTIRGHWPKRFYSLDPFAYQKYRKLMEVFANMKMEILLGCAQTKLLWLFDLSTIDPVMHEFENQYVRRGQSLTPCFSTDQMESIGSWDTTNFPR